MPPASSVDTESLEEQYYHSPGSPSTALSSSPSNPAHHDDNHQQSTVDTLDDIFGSTPPSATAARTHAEPSDLPALRRQHITEGYRDGVTEAKAEHMQRGFDRGYPVGAELGMRVGIILGVLEGVIKAVPAPSRVKKPGLKVNAKAKASASVSPDGSAAAAGGGDDKAVVGLTPEAVAGVKDLYERARKELAVENIFTGAADELEREKSKEGSEPCMILGEAADKVVERWEITVQQLLAQLS